MPTVYKLPGGAIQANTITTSQLQTTVVTQIQAGGGPKVKSLIYPGNDTAANTTGGQTLYLTGSGFAANAQVLVNGAAVPSQSFISASNISFTTPALSTGTYPVYLINPEDGGTAILYPGLLISGEPTWVTSAGSLSGSQDENSSWNFSLSTTGDTPITYALAAGNTLPSGITLAANGLISGTISSPTGNATTYTFSVVATDAQNQDSTRQFSVTTSVGEGVLFANNVLLIHADETNNKNNHTFLDSSNNNFTITRFGNATQGSFSPFSQTGWSNYFDGTGDYLTLPSNSSFNFETGDFTIEFWIYPTAAQNGFAGIVVQGTDSDPSWFVQYDSTGTSALRFTTWSANILVSSVVPPRNTWTHYAIVRNGSGSNNTKLYVNGVLDVQTTFTTSLGQTSTTTIGGGYTGGGRPPFTGYISNLRILKGTALYTSNFTPPTAALTAVANTQLLTCQSNRIRDASNNNFTITRNGDVSVQAFSPFAPTAEYSTANVGGSAYFDGTGDYLSVADNSAFKFGSGDFTVEGWIYPLAFTSPEISFISKWNAGAQAGTNQWLLYITTSGAPIFVWSTDGTNGAGTVEGSSVRLNSWNHLAAVRSGNTITLYVNGVGTSSSISGTLYSSESELLGVGYRRQSGSVVTNMNAYASGVRIVKGSAVYSSNFTPTAPPTNVANTSLLLNFTNAGIFDQTAKNIIETLGDAKVSTTQYKYGTASMYFDGTGDYLTIPNSQNFNFGSGNFTVECWIYCTNVSPQQCIFTTPANGSGFSGIFFELVSGNTRLVSSWSGNWDILNANTGSISVNTWTHFAIVRNGGTLTVYKDGTSTYTNTGLGTSSLVFGTDPATISYGRINQSDQRYFYGYIDDFRVTKGYARYTSNFTAPTSAFKDK